MHDAQLDLGLWEGGADGLWEAFEAVYTGDQDVLYTPVLQLGEYV